MAKKRKKRVGYEKVAVGYLRYSTKKQTDLSIEYQHDFIKDYCADKGYTLLKCFIDEGKTGTNDKRDAFQKMIDEALNEPRWSKIIVFSFNRFARNSDYNSYYKIQLQQQGITIESATQDNSNTPEANLVRNVTASFDAYQPESCAVHTHASLMTKARKCEHCGGTPPLGYDVKDEKLVVNAYEAETVRLIFDMYSKNYSYNDMIKVLNEQGRTTKRGTSFKKTSFNSLLQQEKYKGLYVWNRAAHKNFDDTHNSHESKPIEEQVRIEGGCAAIIDEALFDKVQKRMRDNKRSNSSSNGRHHYMFGGMQKIYCAKCGSLMVGSVYKSNGKEYRYYICPNHKGSGCVTKNIRATKLENFVISRLMDLTYKRSKITGYNDLIREASGTSSCIGLRKELNGVKRSIENLMSVLEKSPNDDLIERLATLNAKKNDIQMKINTVSTPPQLTADNFKDVGKALIHDLRSSVDPVIYDLINASVDKITVSNDGIEVELNI